MNINEEQNLAKLFTTSSAHWELHYSLKLHNLSSVNIVVSFPYNDEQATEREISLSNNTTLSQSEHILMFFKNYETRERCICSLRAKNLRTCDCTFQCCSFKKDMVFFFVWEKNLLYIRYFTVLMILRTLNP